jgi:UDP-N-acetylmuramate dehydrogenase
MRKKHIQSLLKENIPLAPFTTLRLGGAARYFVKAETVEDVLLAVDYANENNLPLFILGGGSNIVVADEGFNGLVLQIALRGILEEGNLITVAAGEDWDSFVAWCVERNYAGIECLSGIPGFVGGTPVQNVGAYGQEVSKTIVSVRVFDRTRNEIVDLTNEQCGFSYRTSIFNTTEREHYIVLSVTFALTENGAPALRYKDLLQFFSDKDSPTLKEVRDAVIEIRSRKSMVINPDDSNSRSAGSFFKNPIVSEEKFLKIKSLVNELVPHFPADDGQVKIPAAWLIERAGFQKGYVKGNVGLSTNHTLAIINRGGATAKDVIELMKEIQKRVEEKFSVQLKPEPVFVGL